MDLSDYFHFVRDWLPANFGQLKVPENVGLEQPRSPGHLLTMQLTLPENIEARLTPANAALHLAIGLFVTEEATLGQAAEIAGLSQAAFLKELGQRRIPIHYGPEELAEDLRLVESLGAR